MMGSLDHHIYYPQHLNDEECWSLLRRISLPGRSEEECGEFEDVGKKIASKCRGLPLAANVLGSLLQFKNSLEEWENVFESEIWQLEVAEVDLFPHLLLSYNDLSPALKRCFSYCAVYPKDSEINAEGLIQEWMAQGYLGSVTRKNGGLEVKGRDYLNNLAMRSLFQDITKNSDDRSIVVCKMHDIVHDFARFLRGNNDRSEEKGKSSCQVCSPLLVSQAHEYRSLVWDKESPPNVCNCLTSVRVLKFELIVNGPPQGMEKLIHLRLLDIYDTSLSEEGLKIICRFYFLQTLSLSDCSLESIPIEIGNLVELRHLDLSYNEKLKELPGAIVNLVELRHLDLRFNKELKELPGAIWNLVELRHLDLSYNYELKELPEEIENLVQLRILNLNNCKNLQGLPEWIHRLRNLKSLLIADTPASRCLPRGLGELSGLCTLETDFYGGSGCNKLGLLKKLNCLSGSLDLEIKITSDFQEVAKDAQEAELRRKDHIHTLRINFDFKDAVEGSSSLWMDVIEALEPNQQKLNKLTILSYMGSRLPQWISSPLSRVKEISLKLCFNLSSLPPFGKLPFLEFLSMDRLLELKFVGRELLGIESSSSSSTSTKEVVAFPKLKWLSISRAWDWTEWEDITAEEEESSIVSILPCLEKLEARFCNNLKKLPHRLLRKVSPSLRILNIKGSDLLKTRYVDKDASEWRSISLNNPQLELIS